MTSRGSGSYPSLWANIPVAQLRKCSALWSKPCFICRVTILTKSAREGELCCSNQCVIHLCFLSVCCPGGKHSCSALQGISQNTFIPVLTLTSDQDNMPDFPFTSVFVLLSEEVHIEDQGEVSSWHLRGLCKHLIGSLLQSQNHWICFSLLCIGECRSSFEEY